MFDLIMDNSEPELFDYRMDYDDLEAHDEDRNEPGYDGTDSDDMDSDDIEPEDVQPVVMRKVQSSDPQGCVYLESRLTLAGIKLRAGVLSAWELVFSKE